MHGVGVNLSETTKVGEGMEVGWILWGSCRTPHPDNEGRCDLLVKRHFLEHDSKLMIQS